MPPEPPTRPTWSRKPERESAVPDQALPSIKVNSPMQTPTSTTPRRTMRSGCEIRLPERLLKRKVYFRLRGEMWCNRFRCSISLSGRAVLPCAPCSCNGSIKAVVFSPVSSLNNITSLLYKFLPTNLGACKPTFYTFIVWGERVLWGAVLSHRPRTKCSISQFFKTNCIHSIFRTIEACVDF